MTRFHFTVALLCLGGLLALVAGDVAQEPKSTPPAKTLPAGLRVAGGGNSWYSENCEPLCKAAGIVGHQKVRSGNTVEKLTPVLEKGEIDVFVWGHTDIAGRGMEKLLPLLLELGPKHNPRFRGVYVQMPWLVHDGRQGVKSAEEYEKTDLAEMQVKLEKSRKQQEAWADAINAKAGKRVVFLVPLGDGMLELRKMIVAGKFPGVTKQSGSVLRGDIMPHQGALAGFLGYYMHFAAIYGMSPEGLQWKNDFNAEQNRILQKLAWDMVSKYPHAGIAKESFGSLKLVPLELLALSRFATMAKANLIFALLVVAVWCTSTAHAQKVIPANNIQVRAGFAVERVYQVKGATEGSWVAMCFDDKGRIYASAQGDHGLFRITPPAIGTDEECKVELVSDKWGRCQGMAWINGSLYVVQHEQHPQGKKNIAEKDLAPDAILRLKDTDGDDKLDSAERLFVFPKVTDDKRAWYEHHIHGIVPGPDGKSIYVISGDRNMPPCEKSRVARHWNRDSWEFRSIPTPYSGGWVLRTDLDGKNPECLCMGLRNCYDIAFNRHGDLFTFDSDLEYDIGMPNYRPTAIRQILSGTDSGWAGSGPAMKWSWTPKWEDIQPPIQDIGPGSPTGVCFGYGAKFPARYQEAFFACDWTFGRIFAVHLTPRGGHIRGRGRTVPFRERFAGHGYCGIAERRGSVFHDWRPRRCIESLSRDLSRHGKHGAVVWQADGTRNGSLAQIASRTGGLPRRDQSSDRRRRLATPGT